MKPEPGTISHRWLLRIACCLPGLFACVLLPGKGMPCGMSTHGEVATRAARYFASDTYPQYEQILRDYPEAYQAGAAFPDWGYAFGYPDASEEAHWPPFLEAMALYLRDRCPRPWDEEDARRVAFFLGVVSHCIADIDWHGLAGVREGFIDVMSRQEFHGDWGAAHDAADVGGEFVLRYEGDMSWLAPGWYFPLGDLAEVYQGLGYPEITEEVLLPRVFILFVGALANRLGGRLLYGQAAGPSPFLAEQFTDYAPGGLDSMALRTVDWWGDYVRLLEEGRFPVGSGTEAISSQVGVHEGARLQGRDGVDGFFPASGPYGVRAEFTERGVLFVEERPEGREGEDRSDAEEPFGEPFQDPAVRIFTDRP
jgi:hypothetical protein